eukprot:gene1722-2260_t
MVRSGSRIVGTCLENIEFVAWYNSNRDRCQDDQ